MGKKKKKKIHYVFDSKIKITWEDALSDEAAFNNLSIFKYLLKRENK